VVRLRGGVNLNAEDPIALALWGEKTTRFSTGKRKAGEGGDGKTFLPLSPPPAREGREEADAKENGQGGSIGKKSVKENSFLLVQDRRKGKSLWQKVGRLAEGVHFEGTCRKEPRSDLCWEDLKKKKEERSQQQGLRWG